MWQKQLRDESEGKIIGENEGSSGEKKDDDKPKNNEQSSNQPRTSTHGAPYNVGHGHH